MIRPTPVTRGDAEALGGLVGARLAGVTYRYLPPADSESYAGGVDGDLAAVALTFANRGRAVVTWAMRGELEGLALLDHDAAYSGMADEVIDASDRDAWRGYCGETVTSVAAAWQISGENCPESLWALRLDFSSGSIVIALGTADPALSYMPDEVVVVFDRSLADSYRPGHASDSSAGRPIETG